MIITKPDDWHVHLRDDAVLPDTVAGSAKHFGRALVMPNLKPALTELPPLLAYRSRIKQAIPEGVSFEPMMTFYLNETVRPETLEAACAYPFIVGGKLYPAGATTHSEAGVRALETLYPLLEVMQELDLVLQIHGETTAGDLFDRESLFIENQLKPLLKNFPRLRVVLEHISTAAAVEFIEQAGPQVAATITVHHLAYTRNDLLAGGLHPHYYCLPILKRGGDRQALLRAATSGNPRFFAGTDSAPHAQQAKESACGCAGIYSAPFAVAFYAHLFDQAGHLNALNHFLGHFGANFYQQPIHAEQIELVRKNQTIPAALPFGPHEVIPIGAGTTISWSIHENS